MDSFENKIAVVTGGGAGMGRELVRQLAKEGCDIALCDVMEENMQETVDIVSSESPEVKITSFKCDVSLEGDVFSFKDKVIEEHKTDHINLLFNNAGIGGGGSFLQGDQEEWEKTFAICWHGVYYCSRAFMPYLVASTEGHIINTSSVNGFWASLGGFPHTSYSAAKFAVKGFTEALIQDLRLNAPHVNASVVMPGHIGTSIALNSGKILGHADAEELSDEEIEEMKKVWISLGAPVHNYSNDQIRQMVKERRESFKTNAPTSAAQAAEIILNGVKEKKWRILVGDDAKNLDKKVRENPEKAYDPDFVSPFSIE
ncbi:MAG: SDR family oxidoreductase [SAR86 cluster bacterium]|nr:SDR family oxidoreductase [SAR86 cluster bacterium]|tara:strand:+ start:184 stop:1125 length:942 start_codon:yes stop_codon:yes gene_type:complete